MVVDIQALRSTQTNESRVGGQLGQKFVSDVLHTRYGPVRFQTKVVKVTVKPRCGPQRAHSSVLGHIKDWFCFVDNCKNMVHILPALVSVPHIFVKSNIPDIK